MPYYCFFEPWSVCVGNVLWFNFRYIMVLGIHIKKIQDKRKKSWLAVSNSTSLWLDRSQNYQKMTKFMVLVLGLLGHNIVKGDVATQVCSLSSCSDLSLCLTWPMTTHICYTRDLPGECSGEIFSTLDFLPRQGILLFIQGPLKTPKKPFFSAKIWLEIRTSANQV